MKKNLLIAGVILLGNSLHAQLFYVGTSALVTVNSSTLVYNGGGLKVTSTGKFNNSGNVMLVGSSSDKFETATDTNFNLLVDTTDPVNKYGQLYIQGLTQANLLTGIVNKAYRTVNNGSYQQIGLPFINKSFASLGTEYSKSFSNTRYSKNEVLVWNNSTAVSDNFNVLNTTSSPTAYYMLGALSADFSTTHNLKGIPYAEMASPVTLTNAANGINFNGGLALNSYRETYNSYLQDFWDDNNGAGSWIGNFGKNIYQYANPFFTNLDLTGIYQNTPETDGNFINNIQGIRFSPGTVISNSSGTYTTSATNVTFSATVPTVPTGDINKLIIKPLQTFVIKLKDNTSAKSLNFNTLRRFKYTPKIGNASDVSASKFSGTKVEAPDTVKQLGVIAYDKDGNEMGRTYFVVYANGISGHPSTPSTQVSNSSDNVIGTYEENAADGGIDDNYSSKYWLYINEVNEKDFIGKPAQMVLYSSDIKSLKFEIRENAALLGDGVKNLSTGTGFYTKAVYYDNNGNVDHYGSLEEVSQNTIIPVTADEYSLYYGKPGNDLGTKNSANKISRTRVVYNPAIDNYIITFDGSWRKADVQVYDMSGKLVISKKNVSTDTDFVIQLNKDNRAYIVTAISEKGEKAVGKIVR